MSITHVPLKFAPSWACAKTPTLTATAAAANMLRVMTYLHHACRRVGTTVCGALFPAIASPNYQAQQADFVLSHG
jgi:hypothetical protein